MSEPRPPSDAREPSEDVPTPGMDRRGIERRAAERRQRQLPVPVERRSGQERRQRPERRRSINQYDLGQEELEFIRAINRFKERSGRSFPTWSEVLQILRDLGYEKSP